MLNEDEIWTALEEYYETLHTLDFDKQVSFLKNNFKDEQKKTDQKISNLLNTILKEQEKVQDILNKIIVEKQFTLMEKELNLFITTKQIVLQCRQEIEKCYQEKLFHRAKFDLFSQCIIIYKTQNTLLDLN